MLRRVNDPTQPGGVARYTRLQRGFSESRSGIHLRETHVMMQIVKVIFAILFPPIAAFLQVGFSLHLVINILLTLLGGLPGMVHALWLVFTEK